MIDFTYALLKFIDSKKKNPSKRVKIGKSSFWARLYVILNHYHLFGITVNFMKKIWVQCIFWLITVQVFICSSGSFCNFLGQLILSNMFLKTDFRDSKQPTKKKENIFRIPGRNRSLFMPKSYT